MIYQNISSKSIIAKVFRDFRVQTTEWVDDAIEWMGEALDAIGAVAQFEDKVTILRTSSHTATLPPDLFLLNEVRCGAYNISDTPPKREDFGILMTYGSPDLHPSLVDSEYTRKTVDSENETFLLVGNTIKTSFEEDWVLISYRGFIVDDDGFPMVPDHYEYKQAMYWYIIMKLMESGTKHPAGLNYFHAEERWLKYCTQARNQAMMPDAAKYDQFLKSWVNLIPNYDRDMSGLGQETEPIYRTDTFTLNDIKSVFNNNASTPTFSPDGGSYSGSVTVTITCSTPNSSIRYTTDGSDPDATSTLYTSPITLNTTTNLKAIAFAAGFESSNIKEATYTITQ